MKEAAALALANYYDELQWQFYRYGFGLRCLDAIRPMELIDCKSCAGYVFVELPKAEYYLVYPLYLALYRHYCKSPFFMNRKPETQEAFGMSSMQEEARYFVAELKEEGYTRLGVNFESFNPTGRGFWLKYFTAYTNSVVRRSDERIIQQR